MTEIKLTLEGQTSPKWLANNLRSRAKYMAEEVGASDTAAALREVACQIEKQVEPPVVVARDAYADQMNLELRQSIAANVLEAMDVDQYLIDAVRNAVPTASADEWARLDGANADEDTRARLTELLSTTVFHCFNGRKLGLSAMQAMAVADALVAAGARFDEVTS